MKIAHSIIGLQLHHYQHWDVQLWLASKFQFTWQILLTLRVLDKAEYAAFESTLNSSIVSYHITK